MKSFSSLLVALLLLTIVSCSRQKKQPTEATNGYPGEVLVVAHEEVLDEVQKLFNSGYQIKDSILVIAEKADEQQFEPSLEFTFLRHQAYEGAEKLAPVVLVTETAGKKAGAYSDYLEDEPAVGKKQGDGYELTWYENVWAKRQLVFLLKQTGPELNAAVAQTIFTQVLQAERKFGLPGNLAPNKYCDSVASLIQGNYGFRLGFPPQFRLEFTNREVVWLWQETNRFYRHIFINIFSDSAAIDSKEAAIANRNSYTSRYLKNDEGTLVKVSESKLFPLSWTKNVRIGRYTADVLRGWYTEEGNFRRGPFVRYFFHDKENHRIIALDGFIHAPDMPRLSFYRTFDLIAATLDIK